MITDIRQGLEILKKHIKVAPEKPGVYRMIGADEKVLYVGKAKTSRKESLPIRILTNCPIVCRGWFRKSGEWSLLSLKTRPRPC